MPAGRWELGACTPVPLPPAAALRPPRPPRLLPRLATLLAPAGRPGCAAGGPAPFHFDWAAQLARASPGSRAAALGAMAEDDRLAVQVGGWGRVGGWAGGQGSVRRGAGRCRRDACERVMPAGCTPTCTHPQRVLDEATLGDSYMEGPEYDGYAPTSAEAAAAAVAAPQRDASRPASQAGGDMGSRSSSRASLGAGSEARPASAAAAAPLPSYGQLFGGATQEGSAGAAPAAKPAARPAPPPADDDLLGFGGGSGRSGGPAPAPAASAAGEDLLGFGGGSAASSTAHIDDLFTVPAARPAAAAPARGAAPRPASSASASRGSGLDSMIDLGADLPDVDTSGYEELYAGGQVRGAGAPLWVVVRGHGGGGRPAACCCSAGETCLSLQCSAQECVALTERRRMRAPRATSPRCAARCARSGCKRSTSA